MTNERALELLGIERQCLLRNRDGCDRNCAECDLVQEDEELEEMYCMAQRIVSAHIPEEPIMVDTEGHGFYRAYCPSCKKAMVDHESFCPNCGKAIKWAEWDDHTALWMKHREVGEPTERNAADRDD